MMDTMTTSDPIRLLGLRDTALSLDEVHRAVRHDGAGATDLFVGTVRDHNRGRAVSALEYSAHPTAEAELRRVAEKVCVDYPVLALAAVHRIGLLAIGDTAVIVAVSTAHRGDAFEACRRLIDTLKHEVPIWKHEHFADGTQDWVAAGTAG